MSEPHITVTAVDDGYIHLDLTAGSPVGVSMTLTQDEAYAFCSQVMEHITAETCARNLRQRIIVGIDQMSQDRDDIEKHAAVRLRFDGGTNV